MVSRKKATDLLDGLAAEAKQEMDYAAKARAVDSRARVDADRKRLAKVVKNLQLELDRERDYNEIVERLRADPVKPHIMRRTERSKKVMEATAGLLLSDLHFEEQVDKREVNGLNEFNLAIATERCDRLSVGFAWYVRMLRGVYKVRKIYAPMLGDNVTNWLHGAEDMASNFLGPFEAVAFARDRMVQIFDAMLKIEDIDEIFVPIIPGNHDRMPNSRKNPFRARTQLSLAFILADMLATHYKDEPRLIFELSFSSSHYTEIYGHKVRGMHGDGFSYNRGVGGIYVGARRFIGEMNKSIPAALTVFGHHHQHKVDSDWISNGSLIGWTAYANGRGYSFEPAAQVAFALDRDRGKRLPVQLQLQDGESWT